MSEKRRGLGRGLGALIPSGTPTSKPTGDRPVDVLFPERSPEGAKAEAVATIERETPEATRPATNGRKTSAASGQGGNGAGGRAGNGSGNGRGATSTLSRPAAEQDLVPVPGATFAELP